MNEGLGRVFLNDLSSPLIDIAQDFVDFLPLLFNCS